jgi:hypothetical protein
MTTRNTLVLLSAAAVLGLATAASAQSSAGSSFGDPAAVAPAGSAARSSDTMQPGSPAASSDAMASGSHAAPMKHKMKKHKSGSSMGSGSMNSMNSTSGNLTAQSH